MSEWLGPRTLQNLANFEYTLENRLYEASVSVLREDLEDDSLGVYTGMIVPQLANAAAHWADDEVVAILRAGTSGLGFDGLSFFNDAHTLDPAGTQDNNFAGTALSAANYQTVRAAMRCYTGENGEAMKVNPTLMIVPPQLEKTALEILRAETVASGGAGVTNVLRGTAELLVLETLCADSTTWYLADVSKPIKPLLWQLRRAAQINRITQPNERGVFLDRELVYGVDGRGAAGYGPWWLMARAVA